MHMSRPRPAIACAIFREKESRLSIINTRPLSDFSSAGLFVIAKILPDFLYSNKFSISNEVRSNLPTFVLSKSGGNQPQTFRIACDFQTASSTSLSGFDLIVMPPPAPTLPCHSLPLRCASRVLIKIFQEQSPE